ncbi:MAG: formylglycine-generating enzyme family protein [Fibrobacter sp.]|nr:formylglycine-generating enzyme family protein [Fibrobacter sp.]
MRHWKFKIAALAFAGMLGACSSPTNGETGGLDCPECAVKTSSASYASSSSTEVSSASKTSSSSVTLSVSWIETSAFSISQTEITQADYEALMGTLPAQMTKAVGDSFPVSNVSWYDAVLFANALSKVLGLDTAYSYTSVGAGNKIAGVQIDLEANAVRLPTKAEWKVAARAGSSDTYYWGTAKASDYAQYNNLTDTYQVVAQKLPNAWGLYDVAGNVAEWTSDTALCGGNWTSVAKEIALDAYENHLPDYASTTTGIRVILISKNEP